MLVDECFTLGQQNPKPIVVVFQTIQDKQMVMQAKHLLKGETSDADRKIYISDYTPQVVQDKRKRDADVRKIALGKHGVDNITYTNPGLTVAGIPCRKKVVPPTPRELVNVPPEDLQRILKIPVARSDNVTEDGGVFTAYTAAVSTHKEVRDLYLKLKMVQPSAKHIVCSYWVDHPEEYYALDYHDDGEHTVGRLLMDFLKENDLKNRVIFVARRYGGVKMGAARFNCYLKVAKQSIIKGQFNHVLQTEQQVICDNPRMIRKPRSTTDFLNRRMRKIDFQVD